jgi:hypothetical protein
MNLSRPATGIVGLLFVLFATAGCHRGPKMVPVTGKVVYNGQPLEFGSITFQPPSGQPAQGNIQSDGTFTLSTYRLNDGAVVAKHKVRLACYESQKPGAPKAPGEQTLGKLLIPEKYTFYDQSGFTADVTEDRKEPFVFELMGPRG